jgi:hypothetical protein
MTKPFKKNRVASSEKIAHLADKGEDSSIFFNNLGQMIDPTRRANRALRQKLRWSAPKKCRQDAGART